MSKEQWVDVAGYEGLYRVSSLGYIQSHHQGRWKRLHPFLSRSGYLRISFYLNGQETMYYVHRCVADTFLGPAPDNHQTNHLDGNKLNNAVGNLQWVTPTENLVHAERLGLMNHPRGEKHRSSKLTAKEVRAIRHAYTKGVNTQADIAVMFGVGQQHISNIVNHRSWRQLQKSTEEAVVL